MVAIDNTYKEHRVFDQLDAYADFYKSLSTSVFSFITQGTRSACNIDSYAFSSMQGTLESIKTILLLGRINDAYALLRKYYDSTVINIYSGLYLKDNFSIDNFVVKKVDDWVQGKERLPEYRVMSQYIRASEKLSAISALLHKDKTYQELRERCNDHTHYNFYQHVLLNDNEIFLENRMAVLNDFSTDLQNIFILHFSYMFFLNDHYMMSSDYLDHLECGLTPEDGTQYLVATFVQDIFDSVIKKHRMDIAAEIMKNTTMKLE